IRTDVSGPHRSDIPEPHNCSSDHLVGPTAERSRFTEHQAMEDSHLEIAKRYLARLSDGAGPAELASFLAQDAVQEEFTNNAASRHPAGRRCSLLTYTRYARSSRLAGRAPRRP